MNVVVPILIPSKGLDPSFLTALCDYLVIVFGLWGLVQLVYWSIRGFIWLIRRFISWLHCCESQKGCMYEENTEATAEEGSYW